MSLTTRVLVALVAGIGVGVGLSFTDNASLAQWIEPLGALFINAIRMTIIPLVVSSLIVGVTSAPDARTIGRLGGRALVFMLVSLTIACALGVMAAGPAFSLLTIDPAASAALRASASVDPAQSAQAMPSFMQWLVALVPANPIKAAADGAMLPLIIFSLSFGVALTHIDAARRVAVVRVFEGILDASLVVVHAILRLAPIGVFALAVPLAAKLGLSAAGALVTYIGVVSLLSSLLIALLYPVAVLGGRVKLGVFARAILPAQAPSALDPQHRTEPSASRAQAWKAPALMSTAPASQLIGAVNEPSAICPCSLAPQHRTEPSASRAQA